MDLAGAELKMLGIKLNGSTEGIVSDLAGKIAAGIKKAYEWLKKLLTRVWQWLKSTMAGQFLQRKVAAIKDYIAKHKPAPLTKEQADKVTAQMRGATEELALSDEAINVLFENEVLQENGEVMTRASAERYIKGITEFIMQLNGLLNSLIQFIETTKEMYDKADQITDQMSRLIRQVTSVIDSASQYVIKPIYAELYSSGWTDSDVNYRVLEQMAKGVDTIVNRSGVAQKLEKFIQFISVMASRELDKAAADAVARGEDGAEQIRAWRNAQLEAIRHSAAVVKVFSRSIETEQRTVNSIASLAGAVARAATEQA